MFKKLEEQVIEDRHEAIVEESVRGLDAFKGRNYQDCAGLIKPITRCLNNLGYGRNHQVQFHQLVMELNNLAEDLLSAMPKPNIIAMETEPSITAQFLAEQIKPWVEGIRQELFHTRSAPFTCITDAKKWLAEVDERHGEQERKRDQWGKKVDAWHKGVDEWRRRRAEWDAHWQAILERYPHITGGIEKWLLMQKQGIEVKLPPEDEWQKLKELELAVKSVEIEEVGDLPDKDEQVKIYYALIDDVLEVCKKTGFTYKSAEMHILVDAPPVLPPFTVGIVKETHPLPSGTSLRNRFAQVTIQGGLTSKDLRSLYRSIRQGLGATYTRSLDETHLQLYKLVGLSSAILKRKGAGAFWKSKMEEWNALHPDDKYTTTNGIKFAYGRIADRVEGNAKEEARDERKRKTARKK